MKRIFKRLALAVLTVLVLAAAHFFTVRSLDERRITNWAGEPVPSANRAPLRLAASFQDRERFFLQVPLASGGTLMAFCDTGGGVSMLLPETVERLGLAPKVRHALVAGVLPMQYLAFADLVGAADYPQPHVLPKPTLRRPYRPVDEPHLLLPPMDGELRFLTTCMPQMEAFLGQSFFVGKAWTIDYLREEIWVHTPLDGTDANGPNVQVLGFKKNQHGAKLFGHPSMTIEIHGEAIDVLFDTGATMVLSDAGRAAFATDQRTLGGSFIADSLYRKWRAAHPDWRHYPGADLAGDVIEVPSVKLGAHVVGPVRFAVRPDENWSHGMIASMDRVVRGAVGGTLLKHFRVTADYNSERIRFERD